MRILGIDPGLATVGLGLIETDERSNATPIEWLTIDTKPGSFPERLAEIAHDLADYLEQTKPDLIVIEKLFFQTNRKTAIDVAQARGVIVMTAAKAQIPVIEPNPLELKLAVTGDGKADKIQMRDMVMRTLKLSEMPTPDDAADALGLAIYGMTVGRKVISI